MNFSVALKDFHDVRRPAGFLRRRADHSIALQTFGIGVQKTIVAADGFGHAYCKIHCKVLFLLPSSPDASDHAQLLVALSAETSPPQRHRPRAAPQEALAPHGRKPLAVRVPFVVFLFLLRCSRRLAH